MRGIRKSAPKAVLAAGVLSTGVLAAAALGLGGPAWPAATAAVAVAGQTARPAALPIAGILQGVATSSSNDAWAVGDTPLGRPGRPVLAHWDGHAWTQVSNAALPAFGDLAAVTAVTGGDWVVGSSGAAGDRKPLILRLTGRDWKRTPIPATGPGELRAVTATSAKNAWAIGSIPGGPRLVLHWTGRAWTRVAIPTSVPRGPLRAVAASSATDAWAVGYTFAGQTIILHWDGKHWRRVASPSSAGRFDTLLAVTAASATSAWAVGEDGSRTLLLHWNGRLWTRARTPALTPGSILGSVDASSAKNAWAVGLDGSGIPLTLHWNGRAWTHPQTKGPANSFLNGVSIGPSGRPWAVGAAGQQTLTLLWNGNSWH